MELSVGIKHGCFTIAILKTALLLNSLLFQKTIRLIATGFFGPPARPVVQKSSCAPYSVYAKIK